MNEGAQHSTRHSTFRADENDDEDDEGEEEDDEGECHGWLAQPCVVAVAER